MKLLVSLLGRGDPPGFCECRNCGRTVACDESAYPACGSTEIAEYDIDL